MKRTQFGSILSNERLMVASQTSAIFDLVNNNNSNSNKNSVLFGGQHMFEKIVWPRENNPFVLLTMPPPSPPH
jgi:hypothetical protein